MRHGVIDRPDPHRVDDKARLLAQIEMDQVDSVSAESLLFHFDLCS